VNILRYLARLGLQDLGYDDEIESLEIDSQLDTIHRLKHARVNKEKAAMNKNLNAKLGKNQFFGGNNLNIVDIALWSILKQANFTSAEDLSPNLAKWFVRMNSL